jgi:hypothetical protein
MLLILCVAMTGLMASQMPARADDSDWPKVADLQADGKKEAKEISVGKKTEKIRIKCTEGSVIINTVVVREGAAKDVHTLGKRLNKDEEVKIELGSKKHVDGLRISDDGKGSYKVMVRK